MNQSYQMWKEFLHREVRDFKRFLGYGKKQIRIIGRDKFFKAWGWETVADVSAWRKAILQVVPCPHCKKDFGVFDENLGLCASCIPKFDMQRFHADVDAAVEADPINESTIMLNASALFFFDPDTQNYYRKENNLNEEKT